MHFNEVRSSMDPTDMIATLDINVFNASDEEHEHAHEDSDAGTMTAKMVTMLTLCLVSTCMGIIPMQIARCCNIITRPNAISKRSEKYVSVLLGFGGGVLFCTTFLHILPEVEEGVMELTEDNVFPKLDFSLAKIFCCTGFFIMYFIEELVHSRTGHGEKNKSAINAAPKSDSKINIYSTGSTESYGSTETVNWKQHGEKCDVGHTHLDVIDGSGSAQGAITGLLIVLGLSVHELFEGLAIGLESSATHVWYMFVAVAMHKFIIAFCIGVQLASTHTKTILCYAYVFMFAVVSPLGIGIGMMLIGKSTAAATGPITVILQGIAGGTLMYVVFFEILHKHRDGLMQYFSILLGFIAMFGLQMLTAHKHSHGHSDDEHSHSHDEDFNDSTQSNYLIDAAIERVTNKVVDVLSTTVT